MLRLLGATMTAISSTCDIKFTFHKEWVKLKHVLEIAVIVAPSSRSIQIQVISIYGQGEISYTADDSQLPMDGDSRGARPDVNGAGCSSLLIEGHINSL
jgi:hypothetical protein